MSHPRQKRIHRLPQRLDYALIPAPLDLSLPLLTEKAEQSPLPSIVVTPSSPTGQTDYAIAFMAPPPRPSLRARIAKAMPVIPSPTALLFPESERATGAKYVPILEEDLPTASSNRTSRAEPSRARSFMRPTLVIAVLVLIMAAHALTHRLAARRPVLNFDTLSPVAVLPPGLLPTSRDESVSTNGRPFEMSFVIVEDAPVAAESTVTLTPKDVQDT